MKLIGYYNYTVIPTYLGLAAAVAGIYCSLSGHPTAGILLLMASGLCDMFDGKIARTRKRTDKERIFGIEIDSLCDLVSFGVLPAVIGYSLGLTHPVYIVLMVLYVLAALTRLAYFNVDEMQRQTQTTECRKQYLGLPVTSVALILPILYSLHTFIGDAFRYVYAGALCVIMVLFVLKVRIRKPGMVGMLILLGLGIVELILVLLTYFLQ